MTEILIPEEYQEEKIYTDLFNTPEMIVLASFLSGKNLPYIEDLDPQDFTLAYETFKNIKGQYKKNKSIDQVKASKEGELKLQDINDLVKGYDNKLFLSCYKDLIMQKLKKRLSLIANNNEKDFEIEILNIIKDMSSINREETEEQKNVFTSFINMLDDRIANKDNQILTGVPKLDNITGGLKRKEFIVIGARPSVGKSALGLQFALNMAKRNKVMLVSLEMSAASIGERIICRYAEVDNREIKSGHIKDKERFWNQVEKVAECIPNNLTVLDSTFTYEGIKAAVNRFKPDVLIIDYIGLLDTYEKFQSKREKLEHITRNLKILSAEKNIVVIGLAQLNRNAQKQAPSMAELKESGSYEENADIILLLHRLNEAECSEYKALNGNYQSLTKAGVHPTLLQIEKHRNGETGLIPMAFNGSKFNFREV